MPSLKHETPKLTFLFNRHVHCSVFLTLTVTAVIVCCLTNDSVSLCRYTGDMTLTSEVILFGLLVAVSIVKGYF